MRRGTVIAALVVAMSLMGFMALTPCLAQDKVVKLRLGNAASKELPTYSFVIKYAELVTQRTGGKYQIEAIQERKLGGDKDMIELVQAGAIEMGGASSAVFDGFTPVLNALQLPFLINDYETLEKVFLADFTKELLLSIHSLNLHPLGLMECGYRHIANNTRPVVKPEDLRGLKIRVAETKMHEEMFSALGAIPVPISYGEIYTSLQTGVINGTEINATSSASEKLMEVIKFFSQTGHFFWPAVTFINKKLWDSFPPDVQKIFEDTHREIIPPQIAFCKEKDLEAFKTMERRGIKINQTDPALFFEKSKLVYDKYAKDPKVAKFVEGVQKLKKK